MNKSVLFLKSKISETLLFFVDLASVVQNFTDRIDS